jgi:hypothetical protein
MIPDLPKRARTLDLGGRELSMEDLQHVGKQTTLVGLQLDECPIGDEHVRALRGLRRLVNVSLAGTRISDRALEHLACLPKLAILDLAGTEITGSGFEHFQGHAALETLWVMNTKITDETAALLLKVPKLSIVRIGGTAVSSKGLMLLARSERLKIEAGGHFTAEQMREFEAEQRRLAGGKAPVDVADSEAATEALLAFFEAMEAWESKMRGAVRPANGGTSEAVWSKGAAACAQVFKQHCTNKPRANERPNARHVSHTPTYESEKIESVEQPGKDKIVIYTKDGNQFSIRYFLVRSAGVWKVDRREYKIRGWQRMSL